MNIKYDKEVDALYIAFRKVRVYKTLRQNANFLVDVDKKGEVTGIEILHYSKTGSRGERLKIFAGQNRILIPA